MATNTAADGRVLETLIASTLTLINQFRASIANASTPETPIDGVDEPLNVLRDAAKLLKAHTTKLALLAINKPFTPSAICKIIRELSASCLPAMMGAVQVCQQQKATRSALMANEAKIMVQTLLIEMTQMLKEIRTINAAKGSSGGRDSLSSTGVVWQCCDALINLGVTGVAGVAVKKAQQYRDTIQDAIEELEEWRNGEADPDTEGKDALLDSDDEGVDGDHESVSDICNAENAMPSDRPDIEELVTKAKDKLEKIKILYAAVIKRRLKTFPAVSGIPDGKSAVARLDRAITLLRSLPDQVDELAAAFYSLDVEAINSALGLCVSIARQTIDNVEHDWTGGEDEFTAWSKKWKEIVD